MNPLQQDIISIISRHGPLRTVDICSHLEPLGYGGNMSYEQFKEYVGKIVSKMKAEHKVASEKRPFPKSKPITYWALPPVVNQEMTTGVSHESVTAVPPEHYTEFEADKAKLARGEWSDAKTFECEPEQAEEMPKPDYDPRTVAFPKSPMSAVKILREFANLGFEDDRAMGVFMDGIAAAERHHGIAE